MSKVNCTATHITQGAGSSRLGAARRVGGMALLWLGLGVVVGLGSVPPGGGPINLVASVIAGILVLTPIGALLGLLGGQVRESLPCAVLGGLVASVAILVLQLPTPFPLPSLGLVYGGLLGGTLGSVLRLVRWVAEKAMAR